MVELSGKIGMLFHEPSQFLIDLSDLSFQLGQGFLVGFLDEFDVHLLSLIGISGIFQGDLLFGKLFSDTE